MSDEENTGEGQSEDEKLAAEWEDAMQESGDGEGGDAEAGAEEGGSGAEDEWAAAMAEAEALGEGEDDGIESAPLENFSAGAPQQAAAGLGSGGDTPDLDVILDIPVTISMEVGNTSIPIRNLLQLNQGSVIELDRLAGEPLDVLVNGTLIAHGEVVMVNEKFGIRLTDVVSPSERIRRLN
ncbi:MAG: flagellar motor switch protein FliN [Oleiphilus sp.]|nr:MAG: flagellar motor switch protein FliN [Oleiphilus sp.]